MNLFIESFLGYDDEMKLIAKPIYNNRKLANKFIDEVKIICAENNAGYGEVASYIVSAIFERIKRLTSSVNQVEDKDIYNAMYVLLHISLFFSELLRLLVHHINWLQYLSWLSDILRLKYHHTVSL